VPEYRDFCVFLENDKIDLHQFFSGFRRKHLLIATCIENTAPAFIKEIV